MLFEKRKDAERKKKSKNRRTWKNRFYKFVFVMGLTVAFKGLKGWLWNKKKDV